MSSIIRKSSTYLGSETRITIPPTRVQQARLRFGARFVSELPQAPSRKGKEKARDDQHTFASHADGSAETSRPSAHAQWYTHTLPAMIPVALLGSAVYFALQLVQTKLATEKHLDEANARIKQLEEEVEMLLFRAQETRHNLSKAGDTLSAKSAPSWWWFS
ncbi:hypothetical protein EW145_g5030 [Phellinidium pouzarii]|uniref:Uncharacterized protein n=1 Tax=Phellinidium pouzarii TaxID=167371 RepID=A0A4S4L1P2_9AGAM|nr:hypothetical protein EW145_g5030 [Phellinidium pouzarii]